MAIPSEKDIELPLLQEIEDIKKQLKAVEKAIRWMASAFCTTAYNHFLSTLTGEKRKAYLDRWKKQIATIKKDIEDASTLKEAVKLASDFCFGISEYALAKKVDTADKAMEIAHNFIKKYSPVALPLKAMKEKDVWLVDIDVGALAVKVAKVKVDARTGDILSYEIPEKK